MIEIVEIIFVDKSNLFQFVSLSQVATMLLIHHSQKLLYVCHCVRNNLVSLFCLQGHQVNSPKTCEVESEKGKVQQLGSKIWNVVGRFQAIIVAYDRGQ